MAHEFDPPAWYNDEYPGLSLDENEQIRRYYANMDDDAERTNPELKEKWRVIRNKAIDIFNTIPEDYRIKVDQKKHQTSQTWAKLSWAQGVSFTGTDKKEVIAIDKTIFRIVYTPDTPFHSPEVHGQIRNIEISLEYAGDPSSPQDKDVERSLKIEVNTTQNPLLYKLHVFNPKTNPHGTENEFIPFIDQPFANFMSNESAGILLDQMKELIPR